MEQILQALIAHPILAGTSAIGVIGTSIAYFRSSFVDHTKRCDTNADDSGFADHSPPNGGEHHGL